ncbi:hypothetical protein KC865_00155 [Candidatus Kaiserbacteria bacterium]|nr:hypothetical protein [Candidatus Kaiserbacteria bacterium]
MAIPLTALITHQITYDKYKDAVAINQKEVPSLEIAEKIRLYAVDTIKKSFVPERNAKKVSRKEKPTISTFSVNDQEIDILVGYTGLSDKSHLWNITVNFTFAIDDSIAGFNPKPTKVRWGRFAKECFSASAPLNVTQ